jgi:hypothetical protein
VGEAVPAGADLFDDPRSRGALELSEQPRRWNRHDLLEERHLELDSEDGRAGQDLGARSAETGDANRYDLRHSLRDAVELDLVRPALDGVPRELADEEGVPARARPDRRGVRRNRRASGVGDEGGDLRFAQAVQADPRDVALPTKIGDRGGETSGSRYAITNAIRSAKGARTRWLRTASVP